MHCIIKSLKKTYEALSFTFHRKLRQRNVRQLVQGPVAKLVAELPSKPRKSALPRINNNYAVASLADKASILVKVTGQLRASRFILEVI